MLKSVGQKTREMNLPISKIIFKKIMNLIFLIHMNQIVVLFHDFLLALLK